MEQPKDVNAVLILIIDYDDLPSLEDLDDLMEKAREYGTIRQANLDIKAHVKDMKKRT